MGITHEWSGTVLTITSDSGTSSADLKGEKGDDGARGAQGAQGVIDTSLLDNYAKTITFTIGAGESATVTFNGLTTALITGNGSAGLLRGAYLYNGYGIGGTDRVKVAELQTGSELTYSIKNASEDSTNGIILNNLNTSNACRIDILMLCGEEPTVAIEATV